MWALTRHHQNKIFDFKVLKSKTISSYYELISSNVILVGSGEGNKMLQS